MRRRTLLCGVATGTISTVTGCLGSVLADRPDNVVLEPQSDQQADGEELSYPAYGQPMPAVELSSPQTGERIDTGDLDRTAIITAFFATCPAECGVLLRRLADVQAAVADRGLTQSAVFLPISFDPERDDAAALRDHARRVGADIGAGNWHYLRPNSPAAAERVVEDRLGIGFERDTSSDRVAGYDFVHAVVTLLVNPSGIVERAYRGETIDRDRVANDIEAVVAGTSGSTAE
ncbi:SCO family protein [Halopenitus persicus]|uniref:Protein SCO1/2 n=1 Tax=Halopenitus persicus TaxID=1048396 RepID=A0A1H3EBI4_9EURY|nr:SCO family protein [Halopenitus persicus]SDX76025.1 protein SCO1/2 [Halopenitus persicus]